MAGKKSGHAFYTRRLTDLEMIDLVKRGRYEVDLDEGRVVNARGRELAVYPGNEEGHLFVRLYGDGGARATAVHRLVWMIGAESPIPDGWEVHHYDLDTSHNWFLNLYCLHEIDHRKLHRGRLVADVEEVPF